MADPWARDRIDVITKHTAILEKPIDEQLRDFRLLSEPKHRLPADQQFMADDLWNRHYRPLSTDCLQGWVLAMTAENMWQKHRRDARKRLNDYLVTLPGRHECPAVSSSYSTR